MPTKSHASDGAGPRWRRPASTAATVRRRSVTAGGAGTAQRARTAHDVAGPAERREVAGDGDDADELAVVVDDRHAPRVGQQREVAPGGRGRVEADRRPAAIGDVGREAVGVDALEVGGRQRADVAAVVDDERLATAGARREVRAHVGDRRARLDAR